MALILLFKSGRMAFHSGEYFLWRLFLKNKFFLLACLLIMGPWVSAQVTVIPGSKDNPIQGKVTDRTVTTVDPVLDPEKIVSFKTAHLADMDGKPATLVLKGKITIVEYWSTSANKTNLFWNRMRELENKYADRDDIQVASINYDNALGGKAQRTAVTNYLKKFTVPKNLLVDLDGGVREIFAMNGPVCYLLINQHEQYIYIGRADAPQTEELFSEIEKAIQDKKKWDDYVKKVIETSNKTTN